MDLVVKRVDLVRHFQVLLEACYGLFVFVLAGKELNRNGDVGGIVGVDLEGYKIMKLNRVERGISRTTYHSGMRGNSSFESSILSRRERDDLTTPAVLSKHQSRQHPVHRR